MNGVIWVKRPDSSSLSIGSNLGNCQAKLKTWRGTVPIMCKMMGAQPAQQFREVPRYSAFYIFFEVVFVCGGFFFRGVGVSFFLLSEFLLILITGKI